VAAIVIHAGMPKTGSTSIQRWLQDNWHDLREHGITVAVAPKQGVGEIAFAPYEKGNVSSGWIVARAAVRPAAAGEMADAFAEALAAAAQRYGDIVITSEGFEVLFGPGSPALPALQRLSTRHEVRVAYYARPQHSGLEALWRQTGYRTGTPPSVFLERRVPALRYASTRREVHALAPGLRFEPMPFRRDLLESGDVVTDFARRFLGLRAGEGQWANPGLPLEVVNLLRVAPDGMFWDKSYGNERINRIKQLLRDHPLPEDDRIALSRQVLRKYAHETFAPENAELGWDDFVPPPDGGDEIPGLEALDRLWTPQASPAEMSLLFRALSAAI
jgi:hypothetical protein